MMILLTASSYAQFITVLVVFVAVLAVTAWVTGWIANYQKQQGVNGNIEIIETTRIANNKYVQVLRVGETYKVIAICKDSVTLLGEVPKEELNFREPPKSSLSFKELFEKTLKKDCADQSGSKDSDG